MNNNNFEIKGTKLVEIPFLEKQLEKQNIKDNILIVGEREAGEGVIQTVLKRPFKTITCTDISELEENSNLDNIMKENKNISFIQSDFLNLDEDKKYDYIVCISVLEHFGMNWAEVSGFSGEYTDDDFIRWNHDLRGIEKMIRLFKKGIKSKIIITVPVGHPVSIGDINENNKMPMLRRYDKERIDLIKEIIKSKKMKLRSEYFGSSDWKEWISLDEEITTFRQFTSFNPTSPNIIWAFTISQI